MLNFEEVWNFKLSFLEFKATDLTPRNPKEAQKKKKPKPVIEISLESDGMLQELSNIKLKTKVKAKAGETALPSWDKVGKYIEYKGTYMSLQSKLISIEIFNVKEVGKNTLIGSKTIGMTGLLDSMLETNMQIYKSNKDRDFFQTCIVKGRIKLEDHPRYMQSG